MPRRQPKPVAAATPTEQLRGFIETFDPAAATLIEGGLRILWRRFSTAVELVYDNYNVLAIGWSPNQRASEAERKIAHGH